MNGFIGSTLQVQTGWVDSIHETIILFFGEILAQWDSKYKKKICFCKVVILIELKSVNVIKKLTKNWAKIGSIFC